MTKCYYVFILFFISISNLFSQTEGNETIKIDTIIRVDTVTAIEIDTTMVEESVSEKEKKEFVKLDFYNNYLPSLKPKDTLVIISIISPRIVVGPLLVGVSFTWDCPINHRFNFSSAAFLVAGLLDVGTMYCFGLGIVPARTNNFILKFNIRPDLIIVHKASIFGLNIGIDFIYKAISLSPDISFGKRIYGRYWEGIILLSLGYNFKY